MNVVCIISSFDCLKNRLFVENLVWVRAAPGHVVSSSDSWWLGNADSKCIEATPADTTSVGRVAQHPQQEPSVTTSAAPMSTNKLNFQDNAGQACIPMIPRKRRGDWHACSNNMMLWGTQKGCGQTSALDHHSQVTIQQCNTTHLEAGQVVRPSHTEVLGRVLERDLHLRAA